MGAWIARLLPEVADTFAVHRQLMYWFAIREGYEQLRGMPIFVWDFGGQKDAFVHFHGFYGFPAIDGPAGGVKVGDRVLRAHDHRRTRTTSNPATARALEMYRSYVARGLPWLGSGAAARRPVPVHEHPREPVRDRLPPRARHGLDRFACSGHGFKHSPAIGEAVAQQLTAGECELDLSPFRLARARD